MAKRNKKVTDNSEPDSPGPKDLGEMANRREEISRRAREARKKLTEEVDVDSDSAAVLEAANQDIIGKGSGEKREPAKTEGPESKEAGKKRAEGGVAKDMVKVVISGQEFEVPSEDVERAGGVEAYQLKRAARMKMTEASTIHQRTLRRAEEIKRREKELEEREKKLQERSSRTEPDQGSEPPDTGARDNPEDRKAKVKSIVDRVFSGREDEAAQAFDEILSSTGQQVDPDAIAAMALQKLKQQEQAEQQERRRREKEEESARWEHERAVINRVMKEEYSDVIGDSLKLKVARVIFAEKRQDPSNAGRDVADIAREAGEEARNIRRDDPESERRIRETEKRDLPHETSARGRRAPEDDKPKAASPSQHIERMRKARGLSAH